MRATLMVLIGLTCLLLAESALPPPARAANSAGVALPAEIRGDAGRLALVWPGPARASLALGEGTARLRFDRPLAAIPEAVMAPLSPWLVTVASGRGGTELALRLRPGATARLSRPHPRLALIELERTVAPAAPKLVIPAIVEPAAGPRVQAIPLPRSRPGLEALAATPPRPMAVQGRGGTRPAPAPAMALHGTAGAARRVTVSAETSPDKLELRFRWDRPVPAALFQRGDRLWAVFPGEDAAVAGWRSLSRPDVSPWLEPLSTTGVGGARVFRFRLSRPASVEAHQDGAGWSVSAHPRHGTPDLGPVEHKLRRVPERGVLELATDGVVAQVRDPDSSERIDVLMASDGGLHQREPERLVDLELLPTLQGLAWRPLADGVRATVVDGRLTIMRPGGLRLSPADAPMSAEASDPEHAETSAGHERMERTAEPSLPLTTNYEGHPAITDHKPPTRQRESIVAPAELLGLAAVADMDPAGRQRERELVVASLQGLAGAPRARARLTLARLYLADALGPEARTTLELIDEADLADISSGPMRASRIAMTGVAEALSGRPDPALARLLDHALDEDAEVALWRAYAAALAARWQLVSQEWERAGGLPERYPDPLRRRLGLELAEALLDHDAPEARDLLAKLDTLTLSGEEGARLRLLQGLADARDGRPVEAEAGFSAAAATGDEDVARRAAFLLITSRADRRAVPPADAMAELAAQRPYWRGHIWEARMLERLAAMQAAHGMPGEAVETWQEAIARSTEPEATAEMSDLLRSHLRGLLGGTSLPTMARLALHSAYGDALDGDSTAPALRIRLSEAASASGLTETAAALVGDAGPGPEVSAARLALASALAARGDLEGALHRLGAEPQTGEAPGAAELRTELLGRTALNIGEPGRAAAALVGADTTVGKALRREAAWRQGDWAEVARLAGADLAAAGGSGPLDPAGAEAATWLGLAQERLGYADAAVSTAARYAPRIEDRQSTALLRLATVAPPTASGKSLPATMAAFGSAVRVELGALPSLAADSSAGTAVRTASGHSDPAG